MTRNVTDPSTWTRKIDPLRDVVATQFTLRDAYYEALLISLYLRRRMHITVQRFPKGTAYLVIPADTMADIRGTA